MTIEEVYEKFNIPSNLREHMLTVYSVVCFIKKHWKGEVIDWEKLEKATLLHDLGNVVKFDLEKFPDLLGTEISKIDYWKKQQANMINNYGTDDHVATRKMLEEIGTEAGVIELISEKSFGNCIETSLSSNWPVKILLYSDLRVLPNGVGSLNDRFEDIKKRMPKYTKRKDFNQLLSACREIEKQIQENLNVSVSRITKVINLTHNA